MSEENASKFCKNCNIVSLLYPKELIQIGKLAPVHEINEKCTISTVEHNPEMQHFVPPSLTEFEVPLHLNEILRSSTCKSHLEVELEVPLHLKLSNVH